MLKEIKVEATSNAEMYKHFGKNKYSTSMISNSSNGKSCKRIKSEVGHYKFDMQLDQEGSFKPLLFRKHEHVPYPWAD